MKNIKHRIQQGEAVNGCWLNLGNPVTAEMVGTAGFDWVLIDLEHGAGSERDVMSQLQALEHGNAAAVVRVESAAAQRIHRVLDAGADGIMCPHIDTAQAAAEVVRGMRYPPGGHRGVAKMVRASAFGNNFNEYSQMANERLLGVVQIETPEAIGQVDAIAALDGIDVLFIGPADLTMSMGIFGQFDHPLFVDAVQKTVTAARKAGKATGILMFNPDDYQRYYDMGIRMIACGADASFVAEGARTMAGKLAAARAATQKA